MELEELEVGAVRGALLVRMVSLVLAKAGYEHAEPLPVEEIQGIVIQRAGYESASESEVYPC